MNQTDPTADPVREQLLDALDFSYCQTLGYRTPEELLAAYDASHTTPAADQTTHPCNAATMHRLGNLLTAHGPHRWVVQPGMEPVRCPGTYRLDQIRNAARLHRQQLIGTSELYAVIEAEDDEAPLPADRAALERVRVVLETEAVVGRSALDYRGLIAAALMAVEAHDTGTQQQARCPHGCDTSRCPCLACEADDTEQQHPETEPPTEEQIVRDHVTSLHLIGEQLATIESWMWQHLADVREAAVQPAPVAQQPAAEAPGPWVVQKICCGRDDGQPEFATWEAADSFRETYIDSARVAGHERSAIIRRKDATTPEQQAAAADGEETPTVEAYLDSRCDTCRHTLRRHDNSRGCTVVLCVCSHFEEPATR